MCIQGTEGPERRKRNKDHTEYIMSTNEPVFLRFSPENLSCGKESTSSLVQVPPHIRSEEQRSAWPEIKVDIDRAARRRRTVSALLQSKFRIQGCMASSECNSSEHTDLNELYKHIVTYLAKHCDHEWTEDWIDIDCERSQKIVYCDWCETVQK